MSRQSILCARLDNYLLCVNEILPKGLTIRKVYFTLYQAYLSEHGMSAMKTLNKRYLMRVIPAMTIYLILLPFCTGIAKVLPAENVLRYGIVLLPVLPIGFVFWAVIDWVRGLDEMQQRLQLDAAVFSMAVTGMLFFALGLLETTGLKTLHMILVLPSMILFWGFGFILARKRYE